MLASGDPAAAARFFQRAIDLDPGFAEAHFNLGLARRALNDRPGALQSFARALHLVPGFFQARFVIGNMHLEASQYEEAAACFRGVLRIAPGFAEAHYNLGLALKAQGDVDQAAASYRRAVAARPDFAEALNNLGLILKDAGRLGPAGQCFLRAIAAKPDLADAHYNLGIAAQLEGRFREGLAHYRNALGIDPRHAPARWLHDLSLPMVYADAEEILRERDRFALNLERLIRETPLSGAEQVRRALAGVASTTHFYLQYQGQDDRGLQQTYGDFVHRVMAAGYPQWSRRRRMPPLAAGGRIRVGYVSSFMRSHTVGSFLLGWLEGHRRDRFEVTAYHVGHTVDALTDRLRACTDRFHQIGNHLEKAAAAILDDDLHILVYTDIGMNALPTQLAALRLAPVQCKGWGHPVTTGLPTIDYYLTSDLMEPEGAERHYSETLVRLPNLALNYTPPALPKAPRSRRELGLSEEAVIYLSTQSLFKYLPQHDDIYPRIAREVPGARFAFIAHAQPGVTQQFADRLAKAFAAFGLRCEQCCRILPRLNQNDFLSLNLAGDILLDTLEWSGGKTTLEAIACGLPVVTLPGRFMRGRHACAMLKMMGINEGIAGDKDEYVRMAAELGRNPEARIRFRAALAQRRSRLWGDRSFLSALEDFFTAIVRRACDSKGPSADGERGWT